MPKEGERTPGLSFLIFPLLAPSIEIPVYRPSNLRYLATASSGETPPLAKPKPRSEEPSLPHIIPVSYHSKDEGAKFSTLPRLTKDRLPRETHITV